MLLRRIPCMTVINCDFKRTCWLWGETVSKSHHALYGKAVVLQLSKQAARYEEQLKIFRAKNERVYIYINKVWHVGKVTKNSIEKPKCFVTFKMLAESSKISHMSQNHAGRGELYRILASSPSSSMFLHAMLHVKLGGVWGWDLLRMQHHNIHILYGIILCPGLWLQNHSVTLLHKDQEGSLNHR